MIELADVISDLRSELERSIEAADGRRLRFELGTIELEVSLAVERSASAGSKVRFWVVSVDGDAILDNTLTQRVKLALVPRLAGTDSAPFVSGMAGEREQ